MYIRVQPRVDRRIWPLLLLVGGVYCVINLALPKIPLDSTLKSYLVQPLLWILVAIYTVRFLPSRIAGKIRLRSSLFQLALMIGFLQVFLYVVGGLFSGFGNSPYAFTPKYIFLNLMLVVGTLIGIEFSRTWLVNHSGKHTFLTITLISIFYTLLILPPGQITGIKWEVSSLNFLIATFLPALTESLLATMLAFLAGWRAALGYRGLLQAFWWFCPILPNLAWSLKGLIGVLVPIAGLVAAWQYYVSQTQRSRRQQSGSGLQVGWIVTAILSVAIIWFAMRLFPIYPALVGSGSMSPVMKVGDIVLINKISPDKVNIGDIIEFSESKKIRVMHRVIDIREDGGKKSFVTKGDANSTIDMAPVIPENVTGKVIYTIRKVGWVAVFLKGANQ